MLLLDGQVSQTMQCDQKSHNLGAGAVVTHPSEPVPACGLVPRVSAHKAQILFGSLWR